MEQKPVCIATAFWWVLSLSFKANYLSTFSKAPVICKLAGRKVLDGVGKPTLEVEIYCTVKNYEKVWAPSSCFIYLIRQYQGDILFYSYPNEHFSLYL